MESRHHGRGLSRRALSTELRRRGVADEDVQEAVELVGPDQEVATARQLIAGRVAATRGQPSATRVRKLMGVLARKGYGAALAYRVVREALEADGPEGAELARQLSEPDPDISSEDALVTQKPAPPAKTFSRTRVAAPRRPGNISASSLLKTLSALNLTAARCYSVLRG